MTKRLRLQIITPNGTVYNNECYQVELPGKEGRFGVLAGHMNLIVLLTSGLLEIKASATSVNLQYIISEGVAEIKDNHCILLGERAICRSDIERAKLAAELNQQQLLLAQEDLSVFKRNQLIKSIEFSELILKL